MASYRPSLSSSRGVALIIVLFVMALGSILVINLASSTSLSAHRISYAQRSIESEYVLKSAINLARELIGSQGSSTNYDAINSPWGMFSRGASIPVGLLPGINLDDNVQLWLEVRPADTKIPLRALWTGTRIDPFWHDTLVNLLVNLGFDKDGEVDQTGRFPDRVVTSKELAGLIIDYLDTDSNSFEASLGEADCPKELFNNKGDINRLEDLASIPGFTAKRLQLLEQYLTVANTSTVNLNLVSPLILSAFPAIQQTDVDAITTFLQSPQAPFTSVNIGPILPTLTPYFSTNGYTSKIRPTSDLFDVIAKVDYGTSKYFIKAMLRRAGTSPDILSTELY